METKQYFPDGCVCTLSSSEKSQAIHEMIEKLIFFQCVGDTVEFEKDVIERENMQSTGLGYGVAVAHGSCGGGSIVIGLGVSPEGIEYNAIDKKPVNLLFMIATPAHKEREYLRVLSALVKLLRKPDFRASLLMLHDEQQREEFLKQAFSSQLALETV